jgi:predicted acyl esterase
MSRARRWAILVVVLAVAATAAVALVIGRESLTSGSGTSGRAAATITATDGVRLSAETYAPASSDAPALVVMPVPFGSPGTVYRPVAAALQARGYEVVTYLQRGFHESQGEVDFAGPATQRDASTVITWALKHTAADADRIGMFGMSYGAGVSLLAAAHDPRVRAVAALSTWTDWARSFGPNGTPSTQAVSILFHEAQSRLAPSAAPWVSTLHDPSKFNTQLAALSATRSPQTYVAQLNHNNPAIMIANAYEDSFLPPAQLVDFFDALTTPKRLQLIPGDHSAPGYSALRGQHSAPVDDAFDWLDHYLLGRANGISAGGPIRLQDVTTHAVHTYTSWPGTSDVLGIGAPNHPSNIGTIGAWTATLPSDTDSGADLGPIKSGAAEDYHVQLAQLTQLSAGSALGWSTAPLEKPRLVSGTPRLHMRIASSSTSATIFTYLYEVNAAGLGALISAQPYTATDLTPGTARSVTVDLQPISWTVRAGDKIDLVVDTADPRFTSPTPAGTTVTLSSTASDPATLSAFGT